MQELQLSHAQQEQLQGSTQRRRRFGSQAESRASELLASPAPSESPGPSPATPVRSSSYRAPPFFCGGTKRPPAQRPASLGPAGRGPSAGQAHNKQDLPKGLCTSQSIGDLSPKPDFETADLETTVASKIASFEQRKSRHSATPGRSACASPARSQSIARPNARNPPEQKSAVPALLDVDDDEDLQVVLGMSPLNHRGRRTSQVSSQCPGSSTKHCFDPMDHTESAIPEGSVKQRIRIFSNHGGS